MTNYLTDQKNVDRILETLNITIEELESYVGRFKADHWKFAGKLKGYVLFYDDKIIIKHHFTKRKIKVFDI